MLATEMDKVYQGKRSAYMLFYRKRTLHRPKEGEREESHMLVQVLTFLLLIQLTATLPMASPNGYRRAWPQPRFPCRLTGGIH